LKTYLDCLPCLLNQALKAARAATDDEEVQRQVINTVAKMISEIPLDLKSAEIIQRAYRIIGEITGNNDPFHQSKVEANRTVLAIYPSLQKMAQYSPDRLFFACKMAIAGNSIDMGPNFEYDSVESIIEAAASHLPLAVNNYNQFLSSLSNCQRILYLGDNSGEIVFDHLLIEEINRNRKLDICFVVRDRPVINDVTMDDALAVGMDRIASVVSSGSDAPATILSQCSAELQQLYHSADIIVAKGQGNYESLEGEPGNIFFLMRAKCPLVAKSLGINVGDCVFKRQVQV
jgi:damage-control phosphatase, subfamily I